jgi:hypothetical protein
LYRQGDTQRARTRAGTKSLLGLHRSTATMVVLGKW